MLLFLFHFLIVNMQLIHLLQILHLICVSYLQALHVPIPFSLSTILGGWETVRRMGRGPCQDWYWL